MRFRFTIRDLLWLTLVVAMGLGWWLNRNKLITDWHNDVRAALQMTDSDNVALRIANERINEENDRLTKRIDALENVGKP